MSGFLLNGRRCQDEQKRGDRSPYGGLTIFLPNFFPEDVEAFKKIDFLAARGKTCDVALVEVTPGQENIHAAYLGERQKPKDVIPYDRFGNAENQRQLA